MKQKRQAKIREIIESKDVETQDELLVELKNAGFNVTQATISRDIRELNLVKTSVGGKQKYVVEKKVPDEMYSSYKKVISAGFLSAEGADNIVVIKTVPGMAMAVGAALDNMKINSVAGCIAGDDTVFLAVRSKEMVKYVISDIEEMV